MELITEQRWLRAFFSALDKADEREECVNPQWTDARWTEFLGKVLEEVGNEVECYVVQRRKDPKQDSYSGEYLNIDAMFIDNSAYKSDEDEDWDPHVLPKVVVELENDYDSKKIIYCLWKILCIRSSLRVLVCYQENKQNVRKLKKQIEEVINDRDLMVGEQGSLLVLIGNEDDKEVSENAPWNEYFSMWEWQGAELKAFRGI